MTIFVDLLPFAASESTDVTWIDAAQVVTAAAGLIVAGLVAVMPYARRPKLSIEEDEDRSNSRVEKSRLGGLPHVRLLVSNEKRRRAAQGTRVLIEGYTERGSHQAAATTLGHPSLQWPSASAEVVTIETVFAGASRPITLGYFVRARKDAEGEIHYVAEKTYRPGEAEAWFLVLTIGHSINDNRDKLPPGPTGTSSGCSSAQTTAPPAPSKFTSTGKATPIRRRNRCSRAR